MASGTQCRHSHIHSIWRNKLEKVQGYGNDWMPYAYVWIRKKPFCVSQPWIRDWSEVKDVLSIFPFFELGSLLRAFYTQSFIMFRISLCLPSSSSSLTFCAFNLFALFLLLFVYVSFVLLLHILICAPWNILLMALNDRLTKNFFSLRFGFYVVNFLFLDEY